MTRYQDQEMLVLVDKFNPTIGRIIGTVGPAAAKVAEIWCCVLPADQELPGGVGLHIWRGWIDLEQTFPVCMEIADDEGSWRRATTEDMERFCLPLCEEAEMEVCEEPDEREGKWCYSLLDWEADTWKGFFETRAEALQYVLQHYGDEEQLHCSVGQAKVFHPSTSFNPTEVAGLLRQLLCEAALEQAGEAGDVYLNGLPLEDVGERLSEAVRRELCRPEWRLDAFWVEEETSFGTVQEAGEKELLGGL